MNAKRQGLGDRGVWARCSDTQVDSSSRKGVKDVRNVKVDFDDGSDGVDFNDLSDGSDNQGCDAHVK